MDSIIEALFAHARQEPERPAIVFEGQIISYGQVASEVERFAQALAAWGLQPGDRVALFLEN
ncbi:MAG TPA: AMP-binding protein, partial [Ktedonobacterales bacterium]